MKKPTRTKTDMLPEYDFSKGIRGKHAKRYAEGTNLVLLDPDVAAIFSTAKAVNRTLRDVAHLTASIQAQKVSAST